jgi:hypothetical protein
MILEPLAPWACRGAFMTDSTATPSFFPLPQAADAADASFAKNGRLTNYIYPI